MVDSKKEYEKTLDSNKISKLPFAGVSKNDNHNENELFRMSNKQNTAADQIDFMRSKRHRIVVTPAGVVNMGLKNNIKRSKYKYEPPYGYGGNFKTSIQNNIYGKINPPMRKSQYKRLMSAISMPGMNPSLKNKLRNSYLGKVGNSILNDKIVVDPNLNIVFTDDVIEPKKEIGKITRL